MPRRPFVQFFYSDWLGDTKVRRMPPEARGYHIDMLCHAWATEDASVPADLRELALLIGTTPARLRAVWSKLEPCWESDGNGGLVNPRVQRDRAKQKARADAGKKGGEAKANGVANG